MVIREVDTKQIKHTILNYEGAVGLLGEVWFVGAGWGKPPHPYSFLLSYFFVVGKQQIASTNTTQNKESLTALIA
jgi:hypothetical protein